MCGILGIGKADAHDVPRPLILKILRVLFKESESRGKEASGIAVIDDATISVLKSQLQASKFVASVEYARFLGAAIPRKQHTITNALTVIGHSRLATNGSRYDERNNQPVVADDALCVHNGIIVNHEKLWQGVRQRTRIAEVDTEIIPVLMRSELDTGKSIDKALQRVFQALQGTASVALVFRDYDSLVLATNNGSLYIWSDSKIVLFASEQTILQRTLQKAHLNRGELRKVKPWQALSIDMRTLQMQWFDMAVQSNAEISAVRRTDIRNVVYSAGSSAPHTIPATSGVAGERLKRIKQRFPHSTVYSDSLRRCTTCILPETMPFIRFDQTGTCSYCSGYHAVRAKGEQALRQIIAAHRRIDGSPDCIVGISGGRDSMFCLHYVKTVLGMNPVAYTYDWGMVTDLARRNISRICGKLGIEHIIVSANIPQKRAFIRNNVEAWLKKPDLGLIPLFMAGDKQYFYHIRTLSRRFNTSLLILGENMLERTDFKTGFAGVAPHYDRAHVYTLSGAAVFTLAWYYANQFVRNPAYVNGSIFDTLFAYFCYYALPRHYVNLYRYVAWDEQALVPLLKQEYDFETASDTVSTWRIGDGTSAFYNYLYYNAAGFTENDTFRSNQIREGMVDRETALRLVREENRPRYETIQEYLALIGLDDRIEQVFETIHAMPKRRPLVVSSAPFRRMEIVMRQAGKV